VIALATFALFVPWLPEAPGEGLDASFRHALHVLHAEGARFGGEVIHQYGPYGFAVNDHFHPDSYTASVALRLYLGLTLALLVAGLASAVMPNLWVGLAWALATVGVATWFDVPYLLLPQLALLAFSHLRGRLRLGLLAVATPAMAVASLMKFNYLLMSAGTVGALLVAVGVRRLATRGRRADEDGGEDADPGRGAVAWSAAYALSLVVLWLLAGQRLFDLLPFLHGGWHLSASYGESHALSGPLGHAAGFVVAGGLFWLVVTFSELRRRGGVAGAAHGLALALFLFLAFKHAFVRHDPPHGAFGAMYGVAAFLLWGVSATTLEIRRRRSAASRGSWLRAAVVGVAALALVGFCSHLLGYYRWPAPHLGDFYAHQLRKLPAELAGVRRFAADPRWFEPEYRSEMALLRAKYPLPELDGTVDLYPYRLTLLFAHGLDYQPRPLLQSYQASDPWLAAKNAHRFTVGEGPDHVVFGVSPIDRRLAAMDDAPTWLHLLTDYEVRTANYGLVILDRSPGTAAIRWREERTIETGPNRWAELPPHPDALLWAEVEVRRTLAGWLTGLLFREPQLYLVLRFETGEERTYRFLPGIGEAGFLLSPVVDSWIDFASLYDDGAESPLEGRRVVAARLLLEKTWSFHPEVVLRLRPFTLERP